MPVGLSLVKVIARIENDFTEKFGIPRQSRLVTDVVSRLVFEPEYRFPEAIRGIEGFSHLWLIWQFSENVDIPWSPTVRPPRLGGNERMGVFATRSPVRPNPIGLSSVELRGVELGSRGPILVIAGADLMNGTPIFDIKPYVPHDSITEARGGWPDGRARERLHVEFADGVDVPDRLRGVLRGLVAEDPRPAYQAEPGRTYSMSYGGYDVDFTVDGQSAVITALRPLTD